MTTVPPYLLAQLATIKAKNYSLVSFHNPVYGAGLAASAKAQAVIENNAEDWLRYAFNCWIAWSSLSPEEWYEKLKNVPELGAHSIFVVKLDLSVPNRSGQFPQWIWDWINRQRY